MICKDYDTSLSSNQRTPPFPNCISGLSIPYSSVTVTTFPSSDNDPKATVSLTILTVPLSYRNPIRHQMTSPSSQYLSDLCHPLTVPLTYRNPIPLSTDEDSRACGRGRDARTTGTRDGTGMGSDQTDEVGIRDGQYQWWGEERGGVRKGRGLERGRSHERGGGRKEAESQWMHHFSPRLASRERSAAARPPAPAAALGIR